jgi:oligoendopeptidase F
MELLTMDHWDEYYPDAKTEMAKKEELTGTISFLPWCMTVDAFQQWIYSNPDHTPTRGTRSSRNLRQVRRRDRWSGREGSGESAGCSAPYLHQPLLYIEYGIAQLGALAIYRNYRLDREKAIADYKRFLSWDTPDLSRTVRSGGDQVRLFESYISELVDFVGER